MQIQYDHDTENPTIQILTYKSNQYSSQKSKILITQQTQINKFIRKKQKKTQPSRFLPKKQITKIKQLYLKNKVDILVKNFCKKMNTIIVRQSPSFQINSIQIKPNSILKKISHIRTIDIPITFLAFFSIVYLIIICLLVIYYSLSLIFQQNEIKQKIEVFEMIFFILELVKISFQIVSRTVVQGKILKYLSQTISHYYQNNLILDLFSIIILSLSLMNILSICNIQFLRLIFMLKFFKTISNLKIIQYTFITTFKRQQYFNLFLVFFYNFGLAHLLSVLLNSMVFLNPTTNWIKVNNLQDKTWHQKYIWGYYWGTTTMLTVGFGDFCATNDKQAICLIFIQMVSCILLAYNINCVGTLVTNLRIDTVQRHRKQKIFNQINSRNKITGELETKIFSYIEQSTKVEHNLNFQQKQQFIDQLPKNLKKQLLQQLNYKYLNDIPIIKNFTDKTKNLIAQNLKKKIIYPDQIIYNYDQQSRICILTQGQIGLATKFKCCLGKTQLIQQIQVKEENKFKIINLDFIKKKIFNFQIKSTSYSIIAELENENLHNLLKQTHTDYEHFCVIRDKFEGIIDQFEVHECIHCQGNYHTLFKCPKLHYIPLKNLVVAKYMNIEKKLKQGRIRYIRKKLRVKSKQNYNLNTEIQFNNDEDGLKKDQSIIMNNKRISNYSMESCYVFSQNKNSIVHKKLLQSQLAEDQIWGLKTDKVHIWRYYFPKYNANNFQSIKSNPKYLFP